MSDVKQDQNQGQDNAKVAKQYADSIKKVSAILGGEKNLMPKRQIGGSALAEVIEKLNEEKDKQLAEKVKTNLLSLLETHLESTRAFTAKKKELEQLEINNKKAFIKGTTELFNLINQQDNDVQAMLRSLQEAVGPEVSQQGDEKKDEEEVSS